MNHEAIVTFAAVRKICKKVDVQSALEETLAKSGTKKLTNEGYEKLCRDIGRASEGKEWQDKQLTFI